ncbi:hypothetical protein CsSME_00026318 [Camellia sinensis var. sinensis]
MKVGRNLLTGLDCYLSSWKSNDDPAQGDYTFRMDTRGYPQLIASNVTAETYRTGPWNGVQFSGTLNLKKNSIYNFSFTFNEQEVSAGYELVNSAVISRLVLSQDGVMRRWTWIDRTQDWNLYNTAPADSCDNYAVCGAYGSCNITNSPVCGCLNKFVPRYPKDWDRGDWSNGCMRRTPFVCHHGDGFLKYSRIKLPDTQNSLFNVSMTLKECGTMCLENCSCMAYANLDISGGGTGCLLWFDNLIDIREFSEDGQDLYVRMASFELETVPQVGSNGKRREKIIVSLTVTTGMLLLCLSLFLYVWKKKKHKQLKRKVIMGYISKQNYSNSESQKEDFQLPLFDFATIVNATDNFSINNKLGEGGFGLVYKYSRRREDADL